MRKLPMLLMLISACLYSLSSYALQSKHVTNNARVTALIAKNQLTRIAVSGDRIVNVKGLQGYYQLEKDTTQGAVFIKPLGLGQSQAFTVFITTEKGQNYSLKLTPKLNYADTIVLNPKVRSQQQALSWEKQHPFTDNIVSIIASMANHLTPKGYIPQQPKHPRRYKLGKRARFEMIRRYQGAHLHGEVYRLINISNKPITLNTQSFYANHVAAIAVEDHKVPAHGSTYIYRVMHNE